ncbi:MAG: hypothetical protein Q7T29_02705 [Gallionella sp.]|nr:hypothetical protein [Gallionella sp.]
MIAEALKEPKEVIYRALSIVLSSIFFANIPLLLFLIYMGYHGFFSYDFFSEGVFGLNVFFFLTSIFVLITSMALFWWVVPLVEKWKKGKFKVLPFIGIVLFNLFFVIIVIGTFPRNGDFFRVAYICAIGLFVSLHIAFLLHAKPKEQLISLIVLILIITFLSLHLREQASSVLSIGLKAYGVGGDIEVVLAPKLIAEEQLNGKLILLSPKHIYIKLEGSDDISTIDRTRFDVMTTKNSKQLNKDAAKLVAPVSGTSNVTAPADSPHLRNSSP